MQYGQETGGTDTIDVPLFHTAPAEIEVSGGYSKELLDRTWVKVGVTVRLPCYPEMSELHRAADFASRVVEERMTREMVNAGLLPAEQAKL